MKKNAKSVNEYIAEREAMIQKRESVNIAMQAIVDKAESEKRSLSAEENTQYQKYQSEFNKYTREIQMNVDAVNMLKQTPVETKSNNTLLREAFINAKKEGKAEFVIQREINTTATIDEGGLIPLTVKDVLPPLEMGLIYDQIGVPVQTGVVGNLQWPVLGSVEADIVGETIELTDKKLDLSKINAKQVRIGISFTVSNQAINNSTVDLMALIQQQARAGLRRTLNRAMFSHENFTGDFHGPYAGAKANGTFAGAVPTYGELLAMKGAVAETGVEMVGFCYVMSEAMKATLEATPIDAGSGRMIIENGRIAGYPVFTTEFINYGSGKTKADVEYIAAGVYGYLALNQHGELRMVVDPYTQAKKDCVVITLNADWSLTTLRSEAFALYKTAE
jgi:HK97 family phage major capsid protein